ncbi:MAG: ImmA/IrrE family metallo-endopeptidase [Lachnospiraceae bacterium]|nr:ImmA/IrrE family metallo-endopeptidase [Lachnospiraceae bacterium]
MKSDIYNKLFKTNTDEEFIKFLNFNFSNRINYKPFNCALIMAQRPGATLVHTENAWEKLGYYVKPEATPIIIMQVGGPVTIVYDCEDVYTDMENPLPLRDPMPDIGWTITGSDLEIWKNCVHKKGIRVAEGPLGARMGGKTECLQSPMTITCRDKNKGVYVDKKIPAYHQITLNSNHSTHEKGLVLFHELAHLYCGHVGGTKTKANEIPHFRFSEKEMDENSTVISDIMEYEAELTCKMLCHRNNIQNETSDNYLRQHLHDGETPDIDRHVVLTAFEKISSILDI